VGDRVVVDGRRVGDETPRVVLAFHKPVGLVTTRTDPGGRPTVYDALCGVGRLAPAGARALPGWVFPVGRLDRDTSGLLILTNDHRLGERLTSPEQHVPKTYHARVAGVPDREALRALREGLPLPDGTLTRPAKVRVLGTPRGEEGTTWLEIVLTEGRTAGSGAWARDLTKCCHVRIGGLAWMASPGEWRIFRRGRPAGGPGA
jgi:pseudouridine synthase